MIKRMDDKASHRPLVDNEVVFRQSNERVQKTLKNLQAKAKKEGYPKKLLEKNSSLYFYCECADENCHERIIMKPSKYEEIHQDRSQFIIIPGHQVASIEETVISTPKYTVVKKIVPVPKKAEHLHKTDVDNT